MSRKIIIMVALAGAFLLSFVLVKQMKEPAATALYTIGILQTASHPALDAVRDGFMEELQSTLGSDIAFIVQNAQGSVSQAHTIAQQFHANRQLSGVFAIATPAAQAMSAVEKTKPVIIAAVTDPTALGLIYPLTTVCGVTDAINVPAEIDMLMQLVPTAKTVGLLYTSGETNSLVMAQQMRQELESKGLTVSDFAVTNESDLAAVTELACRKVDVILAPTDNMVASAISLITAITLKYKKPLMLSDNMLVTFGPLAARGVDYRETGKQAAQVAYKVVVEGKKPYELPIEQPDSKEIFINKATLDLLGLTVPASLEADVVLV
jgi:putative ABC transport system substrate-binding protein